MASIGVFVTFLVVDDVIDGYYLWCDSWRIQISDSVHDRGSPGLAVAYVGFRQSYFLGPCVVGKASLGQVRLFKGRCVT